MKNLLLVVLISALMLFSGCMSQEESKAWVSYYENSGITFTCPEAGCVDKTGNIAPSGPIKDISNAVKEVLTSNIALAWTVGKFAGDTIRDSNNKTTTIATTKTRTSADGNTTVGAGQIGDNTDLPSPQLMGPFPVAEPQQVSTVTVGDGGFYVEGDLAQEIVGDVTGEAVAINNSVATASPTIEENTGNQQDVNGGDEIVKTCTTNTSTDSITGVVTIITTCSS